MMSLKNSPSSRAEGASDLVFTIDERLKGLPALKEQVVQLYQSLNQPHLAVPGRKAGPAQAYVLGLRGPSGYAVFVYLHLGDSAECAVYVPSNGTVPPDKYQSEEAEALGFTESMGFIMDNLNFRGRPADEQDALIRDLAVFQREPPEKSAPGSMPQTTATTGSFNQSPTIRNSSLLNLGKLFGSFCLLLLTGCKHVSARDRAASQAHYDLALQTLVAQPQEAYKEIETALSLNPYNAENWHLKGVLLHNAFAKQAEALKAYLKALELKEQFSEARVNLGNLYADQQRYDDAIKQYEFALADVMYGAPFIAQGNMGWAYYKKGEIKSAIEHLRTAVSMNGKYCLGHLQLGLLYEEQHSEAESCKAFSKYREACPDTADAYRREGVCQAKAGNSELAMKSFTTCVSKAPSDEVKEQCTKLKEQLAP